MNDTRFDTLTRWLTAPHARRTTLATAFAALLGLRRLATPPPAAGVGDFPCLERGAGERCRKGGQCCSGRCRKRRAKRTGRCRCSQLSQPCGDSNDCCGHVDGDNDTPLCSSDLPTATCCKTLGAPCADTADCCGSLVCGPGGFCDIPT